MKCPDRTSRVVGVLRPWAQNFHHNYVQLAVKAEIAFAATTAAATAAPREKSTGCPVGPAQATNQ